MEVLLSHLKRLEDQTLSTVDQSPDLDEWSEMELTQLLQDCDDVPPPPPLVSNTDKEEEDQTVSDNNNNNNSVSSLPAAAEKSLEEVTMDLDFHTIFEGLLSYDDEDLFWSDDLLFM
ncbi:hypothetical protein Bca4012_097800 [Brassica carinata]